VVVEALAAGVPVVAMAVDGVPEVVRDGENGFLVAPDDIAGMAARVAEILGDDALRSRLSAGAASGLEEFGREAMVRHQEQLYRELACQAGLR
jgi:glycosyltransferase involved in cell wall biosynthesis